MYMKPRYNIIQKQKRKYRKCLLYMQTIKSVSTVVIMSCEGVSTRDSAAFRRTQGFPYIRVHV